MANKRKSKTLDKNQALIKEIEKLEPIKTGDSKEVIEQKIQKTADALNKLMTRDAFMNRMAKTGYGQPNLAEGVEYPLTRLTQNYQLFNSLYRSSWIVRKIIDVVPADMLKNWIKFTTSVDPKSIDLVEKTIRYTKTKEKLKLGLQWGRLYGGAAALILIEGDDESLEEPLDIDTIKSDSYKGLLIFDRWAGIYPGIELIEDINDPEFGLPEYYMINSDRTSGITGMDTSKNFKVHHSRILRFPGRELPYWEKIQSMYWGESEVEIVYEELKKRDNTSANLATMIFLANIRVLKMNDLGQLLGTGSQKAQENLHNVLDAQAKLMSNMGIYVMDKDDDFSIHNYSYSGLDELYQSFMLDVAGACEMPVTKLFGREPAGFNATGEGDLKQYYDTVSEKQETFLLPVLDKLLPIIFKSAIGSVPDDLDWKFNPVQQISNKDMADLAQSMQAPIMEAFSAGLISKAIALKELKSQSEVTGMWTSITDEYIQQVEEQEKANEQVYSEEEENRLTEELKNDGDENPQPDEKKLNTGQLEASEGNPEKDLVDILKERMKQNG